MHKKLEHLYKLIAFLHPNFADTVFNEFIDSQIEYFVNRFGYFKSEKHPNLYIEHKYNIFEHENDNQKLLDLFEKSSKRIKLFEKPYKTLSLKYDIVHTASILAEQDATVQEAIDKKCQELKNQIKYQAKEKRDSFYKEKEQENTKKHGNISLDAYNPHIDFDAVCLVHATEFYPQKNKNGQYFIETTAHATNFLSPRSTVHFTCNHIVEEHMTGAAWSKMPYVIIAPFEDTVKTNGNPRRFALVDTYFLPDQDKGIILPDSTMIVEPAKNLNDSDKLFIIAPTIMLITEQTIFLKLQKKCWH